MKEIIDEGIFDYFELDSLSSSCCGSIYCVELLE